MSNWFPFGKAGANKTYTSKDACEIAEGQTCYDITGKDLAASSIVNGELVEDADLKDKLDSRKSDTDQRNKNYDLLGEGGRYLLKMIHDIAENLTIKINGLSNKQDKYEKETLSKTKTMIDKIDARIVNLERLNLENKLLSELEQRTLARIGSLRTHLSKTIDERTQSFIKYCGIHTTTGGGTTEEIARPGVSSANKCNVSIHTLGASSVSIKAHRCDVDKIIVEFTADPGTDHVLEYTVSI